MVVAEALARLMRERWRLGFVDIGGWDTHVGQGGATGALATRAGELGRGLAGFAAELGEAAWRDTVVVVMSEFGRTFRENGSRGTDHGHGSAMLVLGDGVRGGRMFGDWPGLDTPRLDQGVDQRYVVERGVQGLAQARLLRRASAALSVIGASVINDARSS